jgi:hypothetical protein
VSFVAFTIYVPSQGMFIVVNVYFVIDLVRKLLDTPSYGTQILMREHINETLSLFVYEMEDYSVVDP